MCKIPPANIKSPDSQLKQFIDNINKKLASKVWESKEDFPIIEDVPDAVSVSDPILLNYISDLQRNNYTAKLERRGDYGWWCLIIKPTSLVNKPNFFNRIFKGEVPDFYT